MGAKTILILTAAILAALPILSARAAGKFVTDAVMTAAGDLRLTFIGHATLMLEFGGKVVHVDPWGKLADYTALPKADLILVTHEHQDHLDPQAVETARKEGTTVVVNRTSAGKIPGAAAMGNGDRKDLKWITIEAVPAYNVVHMRSPGVPYHPKGNGNGYVLTFGESATERHVRVYVAGDTENIPEMKGLADIDVAFLPMNLPFTMTPEMAADAARSFKPDILYPYHFGDTDTSALVKLLKGSGIEVRVRDMK